MDCSESWLDPTSCSNGGTAYSFRSWTSSSMTRELAQLLLIRSRRNPIPQNYIADESTSANSSWLATGEAPLCVASWLL